MPVTVVDATGVSGTVGEIGCDLNTGLSLRAGETGTINVYFARGGTLSAGTTVNVKLHSTGGMDYIKLVRLV